MKKIRTNKLQDVIKALLVLTVLIINISTSANAQFRKIGFVFSENLKGGAVTFGNTLMYFANADSTVNTIAMNGNSIDGNSIYDNGGLGKTKMLYIDIDGNTAEGAGTRNSSSADLILPAGTNTIMLARLYWGGRALSSEFNMADASNQKIKIRKGSSGAYQEYPAAQIDKSVINTGLSTEYSRYQAFADITQLIKQQGEGTYTVGNGSFSTGLGGDFGNYGAWSIVVVYANPSQNFNSVRVIDGFQEVYSGGNSTTTAITLTGLNVPSETLLPEDAQIGVIAWEGDARYKGDFLKVNDTLLKNLVNPSDNTWNGTVTNNGVHVTTKNPNYTDQMGIDIDQFHIGTGYNILPNASSIFLQFGTRQDQYFCGVITAVIKMKESDIKITKLVSDANNNQIAGIGEILTYSIKGKNYGAGNTSSVVLTDSLLSTMIFIPGSLKVNYCPGVIPGTFTDLIADDIAEYDDSSKTITIRLGNGANGTEGGFLAPSDSFEVQFKASFNPVSNGIAPPVINAARIRAKSDAMEDFVDDATVAINGATAQRITYTFTGNGNWSDPANWSSNKIPPGTLPVFSTIIIDHIAGGQCFLDVPQAIASGGSIIVNDNKSLILTELITLE